MTNIKPATPLPWKQAPQSRGRHRIVAAGGGVLVGEASHYNEGCYSNAAYIVHACNAYPRLVAALRAFARQACDDSGVLNSHPVEDCSELTEGELRYARALLRELGEQT